MTERPPNPNTELELAHAAWLENPTIELASDVIVSAAVGGEPFLAYGPAEQILREQAEVAGPLVDLASRIRHGVTSSASDSPSTITPAEKLYREVHRLRGEVHEYPRNPFGWLDLALLHARLGNDDAAERAARTSLGLAPENRLVIRSMARLLLHRNEGEEALRVVRSTQLPQYDPWLASVEISLSDILGRSPRSQRRAHDLIKRFQDRPAMISELAASLGTTIALHGPARSARALFKLALKHPNENVVAQARWIAAKVPGAIEFDGELLNMDSVYEGRALNSYHAGRWNEALDETERWLGDESFSSRPAIIGSFVAGAMVADFKRAERIARAGLIANPRELMLQNNLAFAIASGGDARRALEIVDAFPSSVSGYQQIFHIATRGLVDMRLGKIEEGRKAYERAIELADLQPPGTALLARFHYVLADLQTPLPQIDKMLVLLRECQRLKRRGGADPSVIKGMEARIAMLIMQPSLDLAGSREELLRSATEQSAAAAYLRQS